jgi:hypothetical protein
MRRRSANQGWTHEQHVKAGRESRMNASRQPICCQLQASVRGGQVVVIRQAGWLPRSAPECQQTKPSEQLVIKIGPVQSADWDRQSDARLRAEAWLFGWRIDDASRSGRRASEAIR